MLRKDLITEETILAELKGLEVTLREVKEKVRLADITILGAKAEEAKYLALRQSQVENCIEKVHSPNQIMRAKMSFEMQIRSTTNTKIKAEREAVRLLEEAAKLEDSIAMMKLKLEDLASTKDSESHSAPTIVEQPIAAVIAEEPVVIDPEFKRIEALIAAAKEQSRLAGEAKLAAERERLKAEEVLRLAAEKAVKAANTEADLLSEVAKLEAMLVIKQPANKCKM